MSGRRFTTSLPTLLAVLRALLLVAVLAGIGTACALVLLDALERREQRALVGQAEQLAGALAAAPPEEAERIIETTSTLLGLSIELLPPNAAFEDPNTDEKVRHAVVQIPGRKALLEVTASSKGLSDDLSSILIKFGSLFALASAAWLALVAWRSTRDQQAIHSILRGASNFEEGELAHRIPLGNSRKWDLIAVTMNRMARRMSERIQLIRNQRLQQSAILESMSSAVIALDRNLNLLSANHAAKTLFGIEQSNRGGSLRDILEEPELHRIIENVLGSGVREAREFESEVLEGRRLSAIAEQMRANEQKTIGAVVLIDDVTDIRRLESMRSDFAANVSHELRTPITNIQGYVETLQDLDLDDQEQHRRFLDIIQRNSERLGMIIEDLLTLARLEQPEDAQGTDLHPMSLGRIIDEVIDRQEPAALRRSIELNTECSEQLEVLTRGDLLVEAISNLVSNAIRYGPEHSTVQIEAKMLDENDLIRIAVTDQGPGIPARHVPRLFERFYRVDKARSRAEGGTGLGLAIVKHIALVHGGIVRVETEAGKGSTFLLEIPGSSMPIPNTT
jgi:two-component system phosphate regulon sensor histidine kinase PhoR